jgi:mannose-1-phosphate guanylyltransferase/mannose-6-phosphate isomerase
VCADADSAVEEDEGLHILRLPEHYGLLSPVLHVVPLLSGGAGTRLWPLSRELHPKQLLPLVGSHTMLQDTVQRLTGLETAAPVLVCNEAHRFLVAEQLRAIGCTPGAIVLEPAGATRRRPSALAAHAAMRDTGDALLLVLPADHVIRDVAGLPGGGEAGCRGRRRAALVTFGIVPEPGDRLWLHPPGSSRRGRAPHRRASWRSRTATCGALRGERRLLLEQRHVPVPRRRYLEELERHAPDIAAACR